MSRTGMVDFALIGAAGFVAPRHMQAIAEVGGRLVAAMDPSDSVGVLDRYFPEAEFFTEPERFDRYLEKRRREGHPVDYHLLAQLSADVSCLAGGCLRAEGMTPRALMETVRAVSKAAHSMAAQAFERWKMRHLPPELPELEVRGLAPTRVPR